jgi:hypothetical protein
MGGRSGLGAAFFTPGIDLDLILALSLESEHLRPVAPSSESRSDIQRSTYQYRLDRLAIHLTLSAPAASRILLA